MSRNFLHLLIAEDRKSSKDGDPNEQSEKLFSGNIGNIELKAKNKPGVGGICPKLHSLLNFSFSFGKTLYVHDRSSSGVTEKLQISEA